ncbi:MAG: hypothetical protein NTV68_04590 [Methanomicrobiales archaeon]|nr:hypothetical protein [Methanomicrobiales archaeon]
MDEFCHHPQVILAGRSINDSMPKYVAQMAIKGLNKVGKVKVSKVLIKLLMKGEFRNHFYSEYF